MPAGQFDSLQGIIGCAQGLAKLTERVSADTEHES